MAIALALLAGATRALTQNDQVTLDRLVAAYPDALAGHDDKTLRWRDGTAMSIGAGSDGKTFAERLRHASIADQLRIRYPRGPLDKPPAVDADPGRFRNAAFFAKMYGDCKKGEVSQHLISIAWLSKTWGKPIRVTSVNHVDAQLRAVSGSSRASSRPRRKSARVRSPDRPPSTGAGLSAPAMMRTSRGQPRVSFTAGSSLSLHSSAPSRFWRSGRRRSISASSMRRFSRRPR